MGMNRGLRNNKGNFINMVNIMVFAGVSVGGTESMRLKLENAKEAKIIPKIIIKIFIELHRLKIIIPSINGTNEKMKPKMKELQILPKRIVLIEIGQAINLSNVFARVSHGNTTGPIEVEVMNKIMAINPDTIYIVMIFLPIVKAKKSMIGRKIP
jgi:hypothetical protein